MYLATNGETEEDSGLRLMTGAFASAGGALERARLCERMFLGLGRDGGSGKTSAWAVVSSTGGSRISDEAVLVSEEEGWTPLSGGSRAAISVLKSMAGYYYHSFLSPPSADVLRMQTNAHGL